MSDKNNYNENDDRSIFEFIEENVEGSKNIKPFEVGSFLYSKKSDLTIKEVRICINKLFDQNLQGSLMLIMDLLKKYKNDQIEPEYIAIEANEKLHNHPSMSNVINLENVNRIYQMWINWSNLKYLTPPPSE